MVSKSGSADTTVSVSKTNTAYLWPLFALSISSAAVVLIIFGGHDNAIGFVPMLIVLPIMVYLLLNREKKVDPKVILNESPLVIGMMSTAILSGGSLDTAVREVSEKGPKETSSIFRGVVRSTDMRVGGNIKDGLMKASNEFPNGTSAVKRGLMMVIFASETSDVSEKTRILKDSEEMVLNGLKDMGDRYSSSLNNPCMLIFGIGIMVPMVLMSILPMLTVGGSFSVSFLDLNMIAFITLILIPAIIGVVIHSISSGNPFKTVSPRENGFPYLPILSAVPIFVVLNWMHYDMVASLAVSFASAGLMTVLFLYPRHTAERNRRRISDSLEDMLFDLGSSLIAGEPFEHSLVNIMKERKECAHLGRSLESSFMLCRGDVRGILTSYLSSFSGKMADSYVKIYDSSLKDIRKSGQLAVNLGHQMQNMRAVNSNIENRLKSMKDMMTWTAAAFAPIIMGLSLVLLKPLSSISDSLEAGPVSLVLCIYLIELAFLISVLTSRLGTQRGISDIFFRFGLMVPVSMIIFLAVSGISI